MEILLLVFTGLLGINQSVGECRIVDRPITIQESGSYCLTANIVQQERNQHAIVVSADNVHIDLAGHTISGPGGDTIGDGISAVGSGLRVSNGTITGFFRGISSEGDGSRIEKMELVSNSFRGVRAIGRHTLISGNYIATMSGMGGEYAHSHTFAIEVSGPFCYIENNRIKDIEPYLEGEAAGISISKLVTGCEISGNTMTWTSAPSKGRLLAIWAEGASNLYKLYNNTITGADYAFGGHQPILVDGNAFVVRCEPWMQRNKPLPGTNTVATSGECSDSIFRLFKLSQQNPDDPIWAFRTGQAIVGASRANAAGYLYFEKACGLGHSLSCRLQSIVDNELARESPPKNQN